MSCVVCRISAEAMQCGAKLSGTWKWLGDSAMERSQHGRVARFGVFEVDIPRRRLSRRGVKVHIQDKPFQLLTLLLQYPDEIVTREQLRSLLWSAETFVEFDEGVNAAIAKLRYALNDSADSAIFIETVRGKGYRWIVPVEWEFSNGEPTHDLQPNTRAETNDLNSTPLNPIRVGTHYRIAATAVSAFTLLSIFILPKLMRSFRPSPAPDLVQQQITINPTENPVLAAALSPDGKYLAYRDSHGLHMKLMATNEVRDVAEPQSLRGADYSWGLGFWSPDSTRVLAIANLAGPRYEAWSVTALAGIPTKICDDAAPWAFSPDGSKIVFLNNLGPLGFRKAWQMNADGSDRRQVLEVDPNSEITGVYWSPDGQHLGYLQESERGPKHETILAAIDLKTGTRQNVISKDDIKDFLWLPHGRIVYNACRTDLHGLSCNYWEALVNPESGQLLAKPRQVTQWAGFSIANTTSTANGQRLAFQRSSRTLDVYVADFDPHAHKITTPAQLTHEEGMNFPTGWTGDSSAVLLGSNRTGQWGIFRQKLVDPSATPIAFGMETIPTHTPVSADGRWIMSIAYPKGSPWFLNLLYPSETAYSPPGALFRIPVNGGPREFLLDNVLGVRCTYDKPGSCVVLKKSADGRVLLFKSLDPMQGEGRTLAQFTTNNSKANYDWDLSPEGSEAAVFELMGSSVNLIDLKSGKSRELSIAGRGGLRSVKWSSNGFLAFKSTGGSEQQTITLLYVDRHGRISPLWKHSAAVQLSYLNISPDGRHLAFAISKVNSNVWIVENL